MNDAEHVAAYQYFQGSWPALVPAYTACTFSGMLGQVLNDCTLGGSRRPYTWNLSGAIAQHRNTTTSRIPLVCCFFCLQRFHHGASRIPLCTALKFGFQAWLRQSIPDLAHRDPFATPEQSLKKTDQAGTQLQTCLVTHARLYAVYETHSHLDWDIKRMQDV